MSNKKLTLDIIDKLILESLEGKSSENTSQENPEPKEQKTEIKENKNKSIKDLDKLIQEVILNKNK